MRTADEIIPEPSGQYAGFESRFETVITPSSGFSLGASELWHYRELFYFFAWRDIKVKYKQTFLGVLWAILQPAIMAVIFTLFFGRALNVTTSGIPYPVFVLSGLILWNFFSAGISNAGSSMIGSANLIKKIYFPRLVIPTSVILVALFDFVMAFVIFVLALIIYEVPVAISFVIYWPLALLVVTLATLGAGSFLAAMNVKYRDFRYIIPFLIQVLLFVSPVIYPVSLIDSYALQIVFACNPMYGVLTLFRLPILEQPVDPMLLSISLASSFLIALAGLLYFKRTENQFADLA